MHYTMVLLAKSVYYKYFFYIIYIFLNKETRHRIKKTLKNMFFIEKIKHIKYVLNNYGLQHTASYTHDMPYLSGTFVADLPTISDGRDQLSRKFFNSTLQPTSPLHSLLPPPRDKLPITRLRAASKFPRIPTRTKKYQSFHSYALAHYQT